MLAWCVSLLGMKNRCHSDDQPNARFLPEDVGVALPYPWEGNLLETARSQDESCGLPGAGHRFEAD